MMRLPITQTHTDRKVRHRKTLAVTLTKQDKKNSMVVGVAPKVFQLCAQVYIMPRKRGTAAICIQLA